MKKKYPVIAFIPAILSLLTVTGALTVFGACARTEEGAWMHCHTAQTVSAIMAASLAAVFILQAFIKNRTLKAAILIIGAAGAAVMFFVPGGIISMCMMNTMRCYTRLQPFVRIMAVLIIASAAADLLITLKKR